MSHRHVRIVVNGQKFISTGGLNADLILESLSLQYPTLGPLPERIVEPDPRNARSALEQVPNLKYYFPQLWDDANTFSTHLLTFIFIKHAGTHQRKRRIDRIIQFKVHGGCVLSIDDLKLEHHILDSSDLIYQSINKINLHERFWRSRFMVPPLYVDTHSRIEFYRSEEKC